MRKSYELARYWLRTKPGTSVQVPKDVAEFLDDVVASASNPDFIPKRRSNDSLVITLAHNWLSADLIMAARVGQEQVFSMQDLFYLTASFLYYTKLGNGAEELSRVKDILVEIRGY